MKQILAATAIALLSSSLAVQAQEDDWSEFQELLEQFSRDSQELLQDWMTDLAPLLDDLHDTIDDLTQYEPPEVLPNGDIIIRRKPTPPEEKDETPPDGQIDL